MLVVRNLSKSYGTIRVLEDVSCVVHREERVGLVGANGVGKSTLLKILVGQETADGGSFAFAPATQVGYLPQTTPDFYGRSIDDLLREALGGLRQLEERMRQLEIAMAQADGAELAALIEEYGLVSTKFQDGGGYDIDYQIETIMAGLRLAYLAREREVATLSGGEKERLCAGEGSRTRRLGGGLRAPARGDQGAGQGDPRNGSPGRPCQSRAQG